MLLLQTHEFSNGRGFPVVALFDPLPSALSMRRGGHERSERFFRNAYSRAPIGRHSSLHHIFDGSPLTTDKYNALVHFYNSTSSTRDDIVDWLSLQPSRSTRWC